MRTPILLISICLLSVRLFAQKKATQFDTTLSWSQVKAKAHSENKYIFLDLYATWCGPCKLMDANIYPDDTVANFLKEHFVAVKVQMDSTSKDNAYVKSWYNDKKVLAQQSKMTAYPTFLFFTPEGNLILQDIGYKDVKDFRGILEEAVNPKRKLLYEELNAYKAGNKSYEDMASLALFTMSIVKDTALARQIAMDYNTNYFSTLRLDKICTKQNLDFIYVFYDLIRTQDSVFTLLYNDPGRVDQIKGPGWSAYMVGYFITQDELQNTLTKDEKPLYENIDWKALDAKIQDRYPKVDAHKLILDFKIRYYRFTAIDWQKWADAKDEQIEAFHLLQHAITWMDEAINLNPDYHLLWVMLDTKANLLYKLDRRPEALQIEARAVSLAPKDLPAKDKIEENNYEKMKKGLKTWPDE